MLQQDFDLQVSHIQTLANRDALVTLFANLGYDTETRLPMTIAAMGFTGDALGHEITHIERIADHEQGELQVYLIELKHVTVVLTQALARALRNRAGNFFLVLTSDYERLDFVMMELTAPEQKQTGIGAKQAYLRPRVLTVNRRNPGMVALRVLRRFSYTEVDPLYQWDKLRSAYGIAEWSEPFFDNRGLFSDYYLTERLKDSKEWHDNAAPALRIFQNVFADVRQRVARQKEAVLRTELIEPVLKALGFALKAGKSSTSDAPEPDYNLFASADHSTPIAFCDVYVWDRNLDGRDETRDTDTSNENPGALIVSLLEKEDAPDWGIVTNGKTWRLYSKRAHSRATNYYEIDLEEALASPDPGFAFRYFWLMFRAAAFIPGTDGKSFVETLHATSQLYAKELGERLKDRVFEEIFPHFAEGFIADHRARDGRNVDLSDERLTEIFHGTLTFLYRLLFLLYAESRDLLPVREERGYFEISLTRMKQEIAAYAESIQDEAQAKLDKHYSATNTGLYDRLTRLFEAIDRGDTSLNVPLYNGGLFLTHPAPDDATPEAANARFLAVHNIPDRYLAHGLDLMARDIDDKTLALALIDFKSLGVRQLGSIYEGVLEFKLRVASEKMAVVKGKKTDEVIPFREAREQRVREIIAKGAVYLENDKRERKATGSYYTPDYIVKYIVQHTVGPALDEKCEALRPKLREAQKAHRDAVSRQQAFQKQGMKGDDPEKVAYSFHEVVDDLFDLRVLDPAMGSGHFLVEAVDFVTDGMLDFLNAFPWNPVTAALRETRATILAQMQEQGVSIDPARLTDVNLLKRHVLKRCVYGVDLNPMAVELAKVSLWLDCFTLGAPLSFLDHHLKCGNSLIGTQVNPVRSEIEMVERTGRLRTTESARQYKTVQQSAFQFEMFGTLWAGAMLATDMMQKVGELSDVTAAQVKESRAEFRKATDALAPFKRILDVYTSRWFGNGASKSQGKLGLEPTIDFLRRPEATEWLKNPDKGTKELPLEMQKVAVTALTATDSKKFFHWELEFPEVFFGPSEASAQEIVLKEHAGFDAVVGNPPYRDLKELDRETVSILFQFFESTKNRVNVYSAFLERGLILARIGGEIGLIVPNSWLTQSSYANLRQRVMSETQLHHLVRVPETAFPEQKVETTIIATTKGTPSPEAVTEYIGYKDSAVVQLIEKGNASFYGVELQSKVATEGGRLWTSQVGGDKLIDRIDGVSTKLLEICNFSLGLTPYDKYSGHTPDQIESRIFHASYKKDKTYKPLLEGGDISRYLVQWNEKEWLSYGDWLGSPRERRFFTEPRILVKQIIDWTTRRIHAGFTTEELYNAQVAFNLITIRQESPLYLLSLLNSKLINYYHIKRFLDAAKVRFQKVLIQDAKRFPIRRVHFTTPATQRKTRIAALVANYEHQADTEMLSDIERCLPKDADGTFLAFKPGATGAEEQSDVVHDLLSYLAEQMTALAKQKRAEQKRFLMWLEGALKISADKNGNIGIDALTGKTTLRGYLGDYQKAEDATPFDAIMDVLHKNRNHIGVSVSDARFVAKLRAEYERSLAVLLPIKAQLARTDALIDQVVYRLYGLTEEEIHVVEGK